MHESALEWSGTNNTVIAKMPGVGYTCLQIISNRSAKYLTSRTNM